MIKIERSWHKRAQIKLDSQRPEIQLDLDAPDFLEKLLPFSDAPTYQNYPAKLKLLILSAGWVIYNQKTIAIETEIICPSCIDLLHLGPRLSYASAATISETLADEAFHTLFSINMCELAITQRGLSIQWPELELTRHLSHAQTTMSEADFKVYRLAFSLVSETFISDYLADLSDATHIQPVFRHAVALHKKDELVHKHIFPLFVQPIVDDFTPQQKTLFTRGIANSIRIFPMREISAWRIILPQLLELFGDHSLLLPTQFIETGEADYSAMPAILSSIGIHPTTELTGAVTAELTTTV
ncbi:MAG: diiron oxygenase [Pseudomonas sp.]